jgi:hypothetical protein
LFLFIEINWVGSVKYSKLTSKYSQIFCISKKSTLSVLPLSILQIVLCATFKSVASSCWDIFYFLLTFEVYNQ